MPLQSIDEVAVMYRNGIPAQQNGGIGVSLLPGRTNFGPLQCCTYQIATFAQILVLDLVT